MRKEYGRVLRRLFDERMRAELPQFEPVRLTSDYVWPGERLFRWDAGEGLYCWVILNPSAKGQQSFTVEVGWSCLGRFPELGSRPSVMAPPSLDEVAEMPEGTLRVASIRDGGDAWWELPDPALEKPGDLQALLESMGPIRGEAAAAEVEPLVIDAIEQVRRHGVPYLEALVERRRG